MGAREEDMKKEMIKLSGILCAITLVASLLLAGVNKLTLPRIAQAEVLAAESAMKEILPEADEFEEIAENVFKAKKGTETAGYCVTVTTSGFAGQIKMLVGIGTDYKVKGIEILSHSETAGLGAKAADSKFKGCFKEKNPYITVVKGETQSPDEVQAITGATVTSRAVAIGVSEAFNLLQKVRGGDK